MPESDVRAFSAPQIGPSGPIVAPMLGLGGPSLAFVCRLKPIWKSIFGAVLAHRSAPKKANKYALNLDSKLGDGNRV